MALRFEYSTDAGDAVGHCIPTSDMPVVSDLLYNTSLHASMTLDPSLVYLSNPSILNDDDAEDESRRFRCSLYSDVQLPFTPTYLQYEIWRDLTWKNRHSIASTMNATFCQCNYDALDANQLNINWYGEPVTIEIQFFIDRVVTCAEFEGRCRALDSILGSLWATTETLSSGIISAPLIKTHNSRRKVFLCHSSRDKSFVRRLAQECRQHNIDVWLDANEILVGHDIIEKMEDGIKQSDFVAVVLSPNFLTGPWAKEEYKSAVVKQVNGNRVVLLPLLRKDCDVPAFLSSKNYADFRKRFSDGLSQLVRAVRNHDPSSNVVST